MKLSKLRRVSSMFSLGRKEKPTPVNFPDPILEEAIEEDDWPPYDPLAYATPKDLLAPQTKPIEQTSFQSPPSAQAHAKPSPNIFEEWNPSPEYDEILPKPIQTRSTIPGAWPESFQEQRGPSRSSYGTDILKGLKSLWSSNIPTLDRQPNPVNLNPQHHPAQTPTVSAETSSFHDDMNQITDPYLERAYIESFKSLKKQEIPVKRKPLPTTAAKETIILNKAPVRSAASPTNCMICIEDFSDTVKPPGWISLACQHEPSVCFGCLSTSIKSDLENKIWNQIKCPECSTLLNYEDIKRLADPETFSRYEIMSLRSMVGAEENFVWCRGCDFGQIHEGGKSEPIVRCLKCGLRSCFVHSVEWHERLTCQEYDEMLKNPDEFRSAIDKEEEANKASMQRQLEEDENLARELDEEERAAEQNRQRQRQEEQVRTARARAEENRLAEQRRERERLEEENRRVKARKEVEAAKKKQEQERLKSIQEIKRRQKENQLSMDKVESTTKRCPGCQWPIEKNDGCDHMTCIKCKHEFCWLCKGSWRSHGRSCG